MPVRDVMTTDVVVFAESEPVSDAVQRLVAAGVDAGPVLGEGGEVVGMLSSTDLIVRESRMHLPTVVTILGATLELPSQKRRFDEDLEKALGSTVAEVMGEDVHVVGPDDTIETAATQMHEHNVSRLPVVDADGHLVGIIARGDILRAVVQAGQ
jgi:CBS domain-containing protein